MRKVAGKYRLKPKPGVVRVNRVRGPLVRKKTVVAAPPNVTRSVLIKRPKSAVSAKPRRIEKPVSRENDLIARKRRQLSSTSKDRHSKLVRQYRGQIISLKGTGKGKILVILACGPSLNEVDTSRLKGLSHVDIMCINKPDMRAGPPNYWLFADQSQYKRNQSFWDTFNGLVINASSVRARHKNQVLIRSMSGKGFSRDLARGFHIGRSSTYSALQVALYMNYETYVFGCDMTDVDGKMHYYGNNPDVDDKRRKQRFAKEAEHYLNAAKIMTEEERKRFIFCSSYNQWPFMDNFRRLNHKKAIDHIIRRNQELGQS